MIKRTALALALLGAVAAVAAPAASASAVKPVICTYVPDLDGNLYGPVCITTP